ncbi:hypothetical protein ARMGADRAFT_783999 [Armillaria gallica]|uniref:Uncharacterized protein n=1 Tax=Armillaria gallica TaxID=47427 RepID=A0A2H3CDW6_ARMGA|nr:hypothetical protein ARMGADRAFT_783999 [Armillaria gallica]
MHSIYRGSDDKTFIFGAHTERGEGTLPRSRRARETVEGDGRARWKSTDRRYAYNIYPSHPFPRLLVATRR